MIFNVQVKAPLFCLLYMYKTVFLTNERPVPATPCPKGTNDCSNGLQCFTDGQRCDGDPQCSDGSDEDINMCSGLV